MKGIREHFMSKNNIRWKHLTKFQPWKKLLCKLCQQWRCHYIWYPSYFFFPDIEVKASKAHTHTGGQPTLWQCNVFLTKINHIESYSNIQRCLLSDFPKHLSCTFLSIPPHSDTVSSPYGSFFLTLKWWDKSVWAAIAIFQAVLGIRPWCGHLLFVNRPLHLNKGQCQCHSISLKSSEVHR